MAKKTKGDVRKTILIPAKMAKFITKVAAIDGISEASVFRKAVRLLMENQDN